MQTCPFCSIHCDDQIVDIQAGRLVGFTPHCALAGTLYRQALAAVAADDPGAWPEALAALRAAKNRLIVLSGSADQAAARAALRLARAGSMAVVCGDQGAGRALAYGMSLAGALQGTLGELRCTGLAVVCGADPAAGAAPRIWDWLGRDLGHTAVFWPAIDPIHTARWLRLALRSETASIPEELAAIHAKITATGSGVLLVGQTWLDASPALADELCLYLKELNQTSHHWYALYVPEEANAVGIGETLLGQTGYPDRLRFTAGELDYQPGEDAWRSAGAVLWVGQPAPGALACHPCAGPLLVLSANPPGQEEALWLPVAQPGLDCAADMLRLDGVPVHLEALIASSRPTLTQAVERIREEVAQ